MAGPRPLKSKVSESKASRSKTSKSKNSKPRAHASRLRLVLVAPRTPGNVGACARAAANFGVSDWIIVAPQCSWQEIDARKFATGPASAKLDQIRVVDTVEEAVSDCEIAVGFSRRIGKIRAQSVTLEEAVELTRRVKRIALVFGNEETGLTREELEPCTHLCTIPSSEEHPSLNLSHAVAVVLAQFYRELNASRPSATRDSRAGDSKIGDSRTGDSKTGDSKTGDLRADASAPPPAKIALLKGMIDHWRDFLVDIGMNSGGNPERMLKSLRAVFERSTLSAQEIRALRGVLSRAQTKLGTRKPGQAAVIFDEDA